MKNIIYCIWFFYLTFSGVTFSQTRAVYNITFTSEWNASDHGTLPNDAHWSKLVGANHDQTISYWEPEMQASLGIENIAEIGNNMVFNSDVLTNIGIGNTEQYIDGSNLNSPHGSITITSLEVSENFPLLTLASMIAPSPDWFIGISNLSLIDETGSWIDTIEIDLYVYDAGTENGNTYSYDNASTEPQGVISSKQNISPFNDQRVGTLQISLQTILHVDDFLNTTYVSIYPNPTNNLVTIKSVVNPLTEISVYDVLGQKVLTKTNLTKKSEILLDMSSMKKGMYLIKMLASDSRVITKKLVRQ